MMDHLTLYVYANRCPIQRVMHGICIIGEPNFVDSEHCVLALQSTGLWLHANCESAYSYVCAADRLPGPPTVSAPTPCPIVLCSLAPTPAVPCPTAAPQPAPVTVTCARGKLTIPKMDFDALESTTAKFLGDQSIKCRLYAYHLHSWVADFLEPQKLFIHHLESGPVGVVCRGKRNLELSESDVDAAEAVNLTVEVASSRKCI